LSQTKKKEANGRFSFSAKGGRKVSKWRLNRALQMGGGTVIRQDKQRDYAMGPSLRRKTTEGKQNLRGRAHAGNESRGKDQKDPTGGGKVGVTLSARAPKNRQRNLKVGK